MPADNRGPELAAITGAFLGLSAISVILRCYVRIFILRIFRPEDWFAILTLLSFISYAVVVSVSISYGAGKHSANVPVEDFPIVLSMRWAGEITYVLTTTALKPCVGIFLLRLCSQTWHKATILTVLMICVVFNMVYLFMAVFQCHPISFFWQQYTNPELQGYCLPDKYITGLTYAFSGVNAVGDWFFASIPIALVRNLELGRRQKISVAGVLAMGVIASTATIVRIFYVWQLQQGGDVLYEFTDFAIWSTIENGLGLIAASVATLRPLFKRFIKAASQYGCSSQQHAMRGQSDLYPSENRNSLVPENDEPSSGIELYRRVHIVPTRYQHQSDSDADDGTPLSPTKPCWSSYNIYQSCKEKYADYHHGLCPREATAHFKDERRNRPETQLQDNQSGWIQEVGRAYGYGR